MGYITSENDPNLVKFIVTIVCMECKSDHCELYIKEPGDKESKNAFGEHVIVHVCPHEIRYRCLDCGNIADKESG